MLESSCSFGRDGLFLTYFYKSLTIYQNRPLFCTYHMQQAAKHQKIESIRFKLWSVHKLHLKDIYSALLELIPLQHLEHFIPMMRECIKASKYDPHLFKYLNLFDLLLNHYLFNQLLHSCLVEFYSKIVKHLNMQNLWPAVQQAMIVRKYWLGRIHYQMYDDLRIQTYRLTRIDVDNIVSVEAIDHIRLYYVEKLGLKQQELFYYLPQLHRLYPAYYYGHNNLVPISSNGMVKPNDSKSHSQQLANDKKSNLLQSGNVIVNCKQNQVGGRCVQQSNAYNYIKNAYANTNVNNYFYKSIDKADNFDFAKRTRCQSEDTNTGEKIEAVRKCITNNQNQIVFKKTNKKQKIIKSVKPEKVPSSPAKQKQQSPQKQRVESPKKEQKQEQEQARAITKAELQALQIIKQLRSLNQYECKQCGISFATDQSRKQHTEQHIKSKLKLLDQAQARKYGCFNNSNTNRFKTAANWLRPLEQEQDMPCHIVVQNNQAEIKPDQAKPQEQDELYSYIKSRTQEQTQIEQLPVIGQKQQICPLCCLSFQQQMLGQQWVIKDAIRILLDPHNKDNTQHPNLMHRSCCKILHQSRSKQIVAVQ